ncbi:hypothetical protein ACIBSV_47440 [Embleya sp. NPDC050154]|uniref:hypothetical protein n=1 Tax=Embleya sp. NPDC050154 TaxID=3363988 RepID=UPI0037A60E96
MTRARSRTAATGDEPTGSSPVLSLPFLPRGRRRRALTPGARRPAGDHPARCPEWVRQRSLLRDAVERTYPDAAGRRFAWEPDRQGIG